MIAEHRIHEPFSIGTPPVSSRFRMTVRARPAAVAEVRRALTSWAGFLPPTRLGDLVIASNEIVSNCVRHGPQDGLIEVTAEEQPDGVCVSACDEGHAHVLVRSAPGETGGFGLGIVATLASRWGATADPTCVWFLMPTTA